MIPQTGTNVPLDEPIILHESPQWIVLAKPANWHSVSLRPNPKRETRRGGTKPVEDAAQADHLPDVESWLRRKCDWARAMPEAGLAHRLDLLTTGCLLVATTTPSFERLRAALRADSTEIRKVYLAAVRPGISERGQFRFYFTSRYKRSPKITVSAKGDAKHEGRCSWRVVSRSPDTDLVEIQLKGPGRRHQIRAGLAHLGHPIHGDTLYDGQPDWPGGFGLHAWKLTVDDTEITCIPPATWPTIVGI